MSTTKEEKFLEENDESNQATCSTTPAMELEEGSGPEEGPGEGLGPEGEPAIGGLLDFLQQQQVMNAGLLANFFTSGQSNVCDALFEVKQAIDTNSKCLLRICDIIESKLSGEKSS